MHTRTNAARPSSLGEERWPWVLCSFLLVFPLSFARRLTALKYTAGLSVGIVLCLAVVALLYAGGVWPPCDAVEGNEETAAAAASCMYVRAFVGVGEERERGSLVLPLCFDLIRSSSSPAAHKNKTQRDVFPFLLTLVWSTHLTQQ